MTQIFRIPVSKEKLKALTPDERVLLILLGYVSNQLMMMQKLLIFSVNNDETGKPAVDYSHSIQTQMILRLLIGLLNEAWNVMVTRFKQNKFNLEYRKLLDEEGLAALENLDKQFGGSNILTKIRNAYAFHHPSNQEVEDAFQAAYDNVDMEADNWVYYFAQSGLNSSFFISDAVILHGIMKALEEEDWDEGQEKLIKEVRSATSNIVEFSKSFVVAVWRKHFGEEMNSDEITDVENAPDIDKFALPFFVAIEGEKPIRKDAVFAVRPKKAEKPTIVN